MSILRLVFILVFLLLIIAFSIPVQVFCNIIGFKLKKIYPLYFYKMIKIVTGININFNKTKLNKKNLFKSKNLGVTEYLAKKNNLTKSVIYNLY